MNTTLTMDIWDTIQNKKIVKYIHTVPELIPVLGNFRKKGKIEKF